MAEQKKTVATPDDRIAELQPVWHMARTLMGGTDAMRMAGEKYLPRWPKEDRESYRQRLAVSVMFPAYQRTVKTLAGKPFSKPLTMGDDVPAQIAEWCEDIDLEGRNLHTFASECMESQLAYGLGGILVDYPDATSAPVTAAGIRTLEDERQAGLRPYWVQIHEWQILGWKAERQSGRWGLTQLRLLEHAEEPDGEFGMMKVPQVRVLEPARWRTYREVKTATGETEWVLHQEGVTTLPAVPFVPYYGSRMAYMLGRPPLLEVAHLNVAHWQSASDQQNILHVARVPILCAVNVADGAPGANGESQPWEMTVGANAAVRITGQDADLKYVEITGNSIEAGAKDLDALEERMRQAGAELLVIDTKLTATQVTTENAVGMCALQKMAQSLEDAIDAALQLTAQWVGEAQGGHVKLFDDYAVATLQEASAQLLLQSTQAGLLSEKTYRAELKRRSILGPDVDEEEESERIDAQGPALGAASEPGGQGGTEGGA